MDTLILGVIGMGCPYPPPHGTGHPGRMGGHTAGTGREKLRVLLESKAAEKPSLR